MKVLIPDCYLWLTAGEENRNERKELFQRYVECYLAKSYPEYELKDIKGMTAICERRR